jgi:hypothetical protein
VDLKAGTLILEPGETKNRRPRVWVFKGLPEVEAAITALVQWALPATAPGVTALRPDPNEWLFRRSDGRPIRNFRQAWGTACKRAGVQRMVHDLRRSAVRNMVRSGTPEAVCMRVSGHLSRSVFERYNIVSTDDLHEAAARLAAYHAAQDRTVTQLEQSSVTVEAQNAQKWG